MVQCQEYFCGVETRPAFRKATFAAKMEEQLTSTAVVQHKVQFAGILECVPHTHNERVGNLAQDGAFSLCVLHLVWETAER